MDVKRPTPRHIIIKRPKVKDKERETLKSKKIEVTRRLPGRRGRGKMGEEVKRLSTNR